MIKKLRLYQISLIAVSMLCIGLLAFMGITAVQKSMRLNVSFSAKPNVVCNIGVKKTLETATYTPIFDNKANQIAGGVRLSGNSLIFDDTRFSNSVLGGEYYLSFTNYSDTGSAIILTFSNANANGVQPYQYIVTSGGTVDGLAITQANSMTINMQKCVEVTLNTTGVELNTTYANTIISQDGHYYQNASEDLNIKLKSSSGYAEPPKINSIQINGSSYEASLDGNNILTIPASAINGNIVINTSATQLLSVSLSGLSNCTSSNANTQIAPNSTYSTTITPNANYKLPETITVKQDGVALTKGTHYSWNPENGQLEIFEVTGEILITCDAILSECTITFDWNNDVDGLAVTYNNSTTPPTSTTYIPGNSVTLANPTKVGCEFLGWTYTGENVEPIEEPTLNLTLPNTTTGDLEITANWGATLMKGEDVSMELHKLFFTNSYTNEISNEFESFSNLKNLIFDFWGPDYVKDLGIDNFQTTDGISVDEGNKGAIKFFKKDTTAYILSPNKILANSNSQYLCAGCLYKDVGWGEFYYNPITSISLCNLDTSKVTNMNRMFSGCSGLPSLNLSNFNTSNVTDMSSMFYGCSSLPSLDLSSFDTSNVTNMTYMFSECSSLISLDLSSFNTGNVTDMRYMFHACSSLKSLDLSSFDTSNVTNVYYMFYNCTSLETIKTKYENAADFKGAASTFNWLTGCTATWVQVS